MRYAEKMEKWKRRRDRIAALVAQGMSLADIARTLRITPQRVGQIVNGRRK